MLFRKILPLFSILFLYYILLYLFFSPVFLDAKIFAMGDFSGSDLLDLHLPFKVALTESYSRGEIPLWTPYLANGFPLLAEGQSGALYPPNILFSLIFSPAQALNYSIILALLLAGWGTFLFSRKIPGIKGYGAFMAGVVFMFSSFFIARMKHVNMIVVAAYLPFALLCVRSYFQERKFYWFVFLGLVWCLQLLAGHPHMFYLTLLMVAWHILIESSFVIVHEYRLGRRASVLFLKKLFIGLCVSGVVALGLASPQILPTAELAAQSSRVNGTFISSIAHPLSPRFFLTFLAPYIWGNPADGSYDLNILYEGIWWENVMYVGILPITLVLGFSVYRIRSVFLQQKEGSWIDRSIYLLTTSSFQSYMYMCFMIGGIVFLYWAMGRYSILYLVSYYLIPGQRLFRFPTRFNLYTLFAISILFGYVVTYISNSLRTRVSLIFKSILTLLVITDLYFFSFQYVKYFPINDYLNSLEGIRSEYLVDRVYPMTQYFEGPYNNLGWIAGKNAIFSIQQAIPGNHVITKKVKSFTDRGWFEGGLSLRERNDIEREILEKGASQSASILGIWNVGTVITTEKITNSNYLPVQQLPLDSFFGGPLYVYHNLQVLPRVFLSKEIQYVSSISDFFSKVEGRELSSHTNAYSTEKGLRSYSGDFSDSSYATILASQQTRVLIKAHLDSPGYVILSDTYYPGWKAYVNGKEHSILRVNFVQRALSLSSGEYSIEWKYEPKSFLLGAILSCLTAFAILLGVGWNYRRKSSRNFV